MRNKNRKNLIIVTLMIGLIFITSCSKEKMLKVKNFICLKKRFHQIKK